LCLCGKRESSLGRRRICPPTRAGMERIVQNNDLAMAAMGQLKKTRGRTRGCIITIKFENSDQRFKKRKRIRRASAERRNPPRDGAGEETNRKISRGKWQIDTEKEGAKFYAEWGEEE